MLKGVNMEGDINMERDKRRLDDVESILGGFEKYIEVCDKIKNMNNDDRFSTITMAIVDYQNDSDKTLDEVLSEFKEHIEMVYKLFDIFYGGIS